MGVKLQAVAQRSPCRLFESPQKREVIGLGAHRFCRPLALLGYRGELPAPIPSRRRTHPLGYSTGPKSIFETVTIKATVGAWVRSSGFTLANFRKADESHPWKASVLVS